MSYNNNHFSMFKSPVRNVPVKKTPISFIKTVASPRQANRPAQIQTSKTINTTENDFCIQQYQKHTTNSLLAMDVHLQKPARTLKLAFSFNSDTTIEELMTFLRKQLNQNMLYFKTRDLNLDYLLTLSHRKVKELGNKRLELQACKIKIDKKGVPLGNFQIIKCIGTGGFSKVYLGRGFGKLMALKVINKAFILQNQKQNIVENQRLILQKCSGHPFITQLFMSFQTKHYLVFCMQYCNGGQLFNLLRKVRRMSQSQAKFYFLQTLSAISHLHSQKILYRDLKPENIIIDAEGHIRLADYGLSKIMKEDMTHSFCGSAEYMAPQMLLKKGHSYEIDYYCLGALLYQLLFGLPPYYSRNQNQLFNNIITKDLQFPQNIEISKDLKKFLQRLLEKDTDLRFKKISDIMAHAWLRDIDMNQVMQKRLDPPFKTNMFQNNIDDSDFAKEEQTQIFKLQNQKNRGKILPQEINFHDFSYISKELISIEQEIQKNEEKRLDFSKKPPQTILQHHQSQKQLLWRNGSMRSIDNSQLFLQNHPQHSPRVLPTSVNKSNQKFKFFIAQNSQLSPYNSHISHMSSQKGSQIVNCSRGSDSNNTSGSKLFNVKSVPLIQKSQVLSRGNERLGSPININNYINIYTNKSPQGHQINFNSNSYLAPQQPKKALSYNNASYQKTNNSYGTNNGSMERVKFSSLDKPLISSNNNSGYLRNNVYYQNNQAPAAARGYLSNFKERFNPNQKIKKSYKNNQKFNFNFFNATTPYKN